jgi:hypothetical protein
LIRGTISKVVTNLCEHADAQAFESGFAYWTFADYGKLLQTILTSETWLEREQQDEDNAIRKNNQDILCCSH